MIKIFYKKNLTHFTEESNYVHTSAKTTLTTNNKMKNKFSDRQAPGSQNRYTTQSFCAAVRRETEKNNDKGKHTKNLTKFEINALQELQQRDDIIITKADKGGALVS